MLPKTPTNASWAAGTDVEVSWGIRYNHGGGYQYRLCPAAEPLTEACFQKTPLAFSGDPKLRWSDGSEKTYKGVYVTEGTSPNGTVCRRSPLLWDFPI